MQRIKFLGRLAMAAAAILLAAVGVTAAPARSAVRPGAVAGTSFATPGILFGVAATSADNAWAVGCTDTCGKGGKTLILHWNGVKWSPVTSPKPVYGRIGSVAAVSAGNMWAVGYTTTSTGADDKILILHWNGKTWTRQGNLPVVSGSLNSVAVSGNTAWAIGGTTGLNDTLIMRLIGNRWYVVPADAPAASILYSIAVTNAKTAWADGSTSAGGGSHGLVMRWNGTEWKSVANPLQGPNNILTGLAAGPGGALWADGEDYNSNFTAYTATTMLWNGKTWRNVSPGPLPGNNVLGSITFVPGGTAWAVGFAASGPIMMRWTGKSWTQVPNPAQGMVGELGSLSATSPSNAWAVGFADRGSQPQTLIEHWNGKTWS
jgi:hypothetical protein